MSVIIFTIAGLVSTTIRFPFRSAADNPQDPLVPIPVVIIIAFTAVSFIGIFAAVLAWRRSQVNAYTLHTFPPGTIVTVHPHPDLGQATPASLPPYEEFQAANGSAVQFLHRGQSSGIFHKPGHH